MALVLNGTTGIVSANIADGAVVSSKIADGTVVSSKIADGTISASDLASGSVVSHLTYTPANVAGQVYSGAHTFGEAVDVGENASGKGNCAVIANTWHKTFRVVFTDGVSNRAMRIIFPNSSTLWIDGEFWITSDFAFGNRAGIAHYAFVRHNIGGSEYGTSITQQYSYGSVTTGFSVYGFVYDSGAGNQYLELRHTTSEGNPLYVTMRLFNVGNYRIQDAYCIETSY